MAKLEEVEKQLYGKEKETQENLESRTHWEMFFPRRRSRLPTIWVPEHHPSNTEERPWVRHPWRYFFGAIFLVLTALAGVFVFLYLRSQGQEARVEMQGNDTTISGGIITTLSLVGRHRTSSDTIYWGARQPITNCQSRG